MHSSGYLFVPHGPPISCSDGSVDVTPVSVMWQCEGGRHREAVWEELIDIKVKLRCLYGEKLEVFLLCSFGKMVNRKMGAVGSVSV